jgi:hypothetical protein
VESHGVSILSHDSSIPVLDEVSELHGRIKIKMNRETLSVHALLKNDVRKVI